LVINFSPTKLAKIGHYVRVRDVCHGSLVAKRAIVIQQKTQRPVQFEITEQTREPLQAWIQRVSMHADDYLFPSRARRSPHSSRDSMLGSSAMIAPECR
jgi:hypothetical protein